uniref:Pentatricopeptide repeat-containing protein n=1 Tax=Ananas comosus var. bracteatus TaxID=296719 RepID=A0A6V7PLD1_ANACO|nr:unnamed protein product [Ananas comosus var. bracteatus]
MLFSAAVPSKTLASPNLLLLLLRRRRIQSLSSPNPDANANPNPNNIETLIASTAASDAGAFGRGWVSPAPLAALPSDRALLLRALASLRGRPRLALRLFRWAERHPSFAPSPAPFCAALALLADAGLARAAFSVAERALRLGLHSVVDFLLLLVGSGGAEFRFEFAVSDATAAKLLDLLLWVYTKCSMAERAVSAFYKMAAHGLSPDVRNCNRILRALRDAGGGRRCGRCTARWRGSAWSRRS